MAEVRIRLPREISEGETISVRALVPHPMEIVARDGDGNVIDKDYNFIHSLTITYNDKTIMKGEMTQALSANPFIEFPLKVTAPGTLVVTFEDTTGAVHTGSVDVKW
jgi:sulfur-oxidizing protein SoxZ